MEKIDKTSSDKSPYFKRNICFDLDYIQADNFIRQYVEHFYDITESPNEFLLTAIITALGALIGNKAYIDTGIKRIFPNIWAVILGKTTALRKSTSIGLARGLLKEIGWDHFLPQIIHENTLIEHLELNPSGLMIFDEWKSFKSKISSRRGQSFKAMLTELYDSYEYKKIIKNSRSSEKKYQENKLENISLSLLAASTLDWFQFDKADIMSGFLPRFLFCTIEQSEKKPIPFPKTKTREKLKNKLSELNKYLKKKQPISLDLSPKAKNSYKKWYRINYDLAAKEDNPLLPGFYRRLEQYILKFSIILHCTGNEFKSKKISAESMQSALKLAKYYQDNIIFLIQEKLAPSKTTRAIHKIIEFVKSRQGEVTRRDLQRNVRSVKSGSMLDNILCQMQEQNIIEIQEVATGGRPKKLINFK